MVIINCTQKLLRRSHVERVADTLDSTNALGAWCANTFNLSRIPFVLLTNEKTLLSTVFPYREFKNISYVMRESLHRQLSELQIPQKQIVDEIEHCAEINFGSNTKRSVLGSMNDIVFQIKSIVEMEGAVNLIELERFIRRTPFSAIKCGFPDRAVKESFMCS